MHPALSVIFFTTISGAGYGLAFVLATGHGSPGALSTKIAWFAALAMISLGLLSSLLHLGNPQRAWRAFSQWQSSWLSREGVMAVLTFVPLTMLTAMSIFMNAFSLNLGWVAAIMCLLTVYCTAMIYASLRTIASWHSIWTPACYLGFSITSGTLIYRGFFGPDLAEGARDNWGLLAIAFLLVAWGCKYMWTRRAATVAYGGSTMETATGLGGIGKVKLLERPHMTGNYLTQEMGYRVARKHQQVLWRLALLLGLAIPLVLLALSVAVPGGRDVLSALAALSHVAGLIVERWLFFATARHAVSLYYGGDEGLMAAE